MNKHNIYLRSIFFTVALFSMLTSAHSQSLNSNWNQELLKTLGEFKSCKNTNPEGINTCSKYVGSSIQCVYKINDFYSETSGRFMINSEIAEFLKKSKRWSLIGHAYEQNVLSEAQKFANSNKAVVAVYMGEDNLGNVAIILPGEMKASGTWGFNVPNSASFIISNPENSYIGKGLSYAFARSMIPNVLLYVRNY